MYTFCFLTENEFGGFADRTANGNYLQTKEMGRLKRMVGIEVMYPALMDTQGTIKAAALMTKVKLGLGWQFDIDGFEACADEPSVTSCFLKLIKEYGAKEGGLFLTVTSNTAKAAYDDNGKPLLKEEAAFSELFLGQGFTHETFAKGHSAAHNPQWVYKKNIKGISESHLLKSYKKEARYSLQKAETFGVCVRELTYRELPIFKEITQRTAQRRGFKDKTLDYYQSVYDAYGDRAKFMIAEVNLNSYLQSRKQQKAVILKKLADIEMSLEQQPKSRKKNNQKKEFSSQLLTCEERLIRGEELLKKYGEQPILACSLFLLCPQETVYLFSGMEEDFKQMYGPYAIQHEMLKYSTEQHIPIYNFYGIDGLFDHSDGVMTFKQSFGGYTEEKQGTFKAVLKPIKYNVYKVLKKSRKLLS